MGRRENDPFPPSTIRLYDERGRCCTCGRTLDHASWCETPAVMWSRYLRKKQADALAMHTRRVGTLP